MMRLLSTRAASFLVLAAIALGACSDQNTPTQITPRDASARALQNSPDTLLRTNCLVNESVGGAHTAALCGGGGGGGGGSPPPPQQPVVTGITMGGSTVGLSSWNAYDAAFNGQFGTSAISLSNVSIDASVIQGTASRSLGSQLIVCGSGITAGLLPANATCSMPGIFGFLNNAAAGPGILVAGPATIRVSLRQGATLLAFLDRSVSVTSPGALIASGFTPSTNTLLIGGAGKSFSVTLVNPDAPRSGMQLTAFIQQGSTQRAAGNPAINCGSGVGVMPTGNCAASGTYVASNTASGSGTLQSGSATFSLQLRDANGTVLSTQSTPVTLVAAPSIGTITTSSSVFVEGPSAGYTAAIQNPGQSLTGVVVQATITQQASTGPASRAAGSQSVVCNGGASGNLPAGNCSFTGTFSASNFSAGSGALEPGAATLHLTMSDPADGVLATQTVAITIAPAPQIDNVFLNSTTLVIDGPSIGYTVALSNPGPDLLRPLTLTTVLTQSGGVSRTVDSFAIKCANGSDGLPAGGSCSPASQLSVKSAGGTGTLTPGQPTNLVFQLVDTATGKVLATFVQSVTLQ